MTCMVDSLKPKSISKKSFQIIGGFLRKGLDIRNLVSNFAVLLEECIQM